MADRVIDIAQGEKEYLNRKVKMQSEIEICCQSHEFY